ncbi:MAG TPA: TraR/DksA family transcriptional regulator [Candidatus Hydrogenedentes bacterium]|nr:TraR/DksA family transcriptional regulator [Candidatus Hydrogenedentota bacterium]HQM51462.1 TraR/DksA family transcriptional regulator [Candidatus Hydrogenedentota bacterium]
MNKRDAKKFQKLLLEERERLVRGVRQLEEDTLYQPATDNVSDVSSYAEVGTDSFEREIALSLAGVGSRQLHEVADALRRIEEGSYGKCEGCQKEILRKRLEAFPSARFCIECQSALERGGVL